MTIRGIGGRLFGLAMRVQIGRAGVRGLDDLRHYAEDGRPSPLSSAGLAVTDVAGLARTRRT